MLVSKKSPLGDFFCVRYNKIFMKTIREFLSNNTTLAAIYAGNLLFSLHYYVIIYINSSYLSQFFTSTQLSVVYAGGSVFNLILFLRAPWIIRKVGAYHFLLVSSLLEGLGIAGLIFSHSALAAGFFFTIHQIVVAMVFFSLDIFLEAETKEETKTGILRSLYLTIGNIVLVISPILVSFLVIDDNYAFIYIISTLIMVPFLLVLMSILSKAPIAIPSHIEIGKSIKGLWGHANVKWVTLAQLILQTFYAWMVIYTPIYLHEFVGFDWDSIGILFTIMLLPFILFEIPVGKLADAEFGEREFMIFGFIIMTLSLCLIPLLPYPNFGLWAFILFLTRMGASFVEVTSDSYFFRQVADGDSDWISLFRSTRSIGYIIAPILASICIMLLPYRFMFTVLGVITASGILFARNITDSK